MFVLRPVLISSLLPLPRLRLAGLAGSRLSELGGFPGSALVSHRLGLSLADLHEIEPDPRTKVPLGSGPGTQSIPSSSSPGATPSPPANWISVSIRQTRSPCSSRPISRSEEH